MAGFFLSVLQLLPIWFKFPNTSSISELVECKAISVLDSSAQICHSADMSLAVRWVIRVLDWLTIWTPSVRNEPEHIRTGRLGEEAAYFFLRKRGYVIVARNWRGSGRRGELDLVGWDGPTFCFIEVKTRSARGLVAAEMAVDVAKQGELTGMARLYRKHIPPGTPTRFDVVSVYLSRPPEIELVRGAFERR